MSRRRQNKGSSLGKWIFIVFLLIIVMLLLIAYIMISGNKADSNPVTRNINRSINRKVTEEAVEQVITQSTGEKVSIKEIESQMSEEDAGELDDIIDKYSENGLVTEALKVYSENGGDVDATVQEMKDKVSPEDVEALKKLYSKYY